MANLNDLNEGESVTIRDGRRGFGFEFPDGFRDTIWYSQAEFQALTRVQMTAAKRDRHDAWKATVVPTATPVQSELTRREQRRLYHQQAMAALSTLEELDSTPEGG